MEMEKKKAAALAAVSFYIKSEEESLVAATAVAPREEVQTRPMRHFSPWGTGGRMQQMQMRNYMQMKAFHKL